MIKYEFSNTIKSIILNCSHTGSKVFDNVKSYYRRKFAYSTESLSNKLKEKSRSNELKVNIISPKKNEKFPCVGLRRKISLFFYVHI